MSASSDAVIARVKVREAAGIFRARDELDSAADALLLSGFDRADIDLTTRDAVRKKLGIDIPPEEMPEVPDIPRQPFLGREDFVITTAMSTGILIFAGAALGVGIVIASGGTATMAIIAAIAGAAIAGVIGHYVIRLIRRKRLPAFDIESATAEFALLVRVRSPEQETRAQEILRGHGAAAVRVHEIDIDKRLKNIPLSSLRVDPWLGDERLGQP
jgi:hypothetical protein